MRIDETIAALDAVMDAHRSVKYARKQAQYWAAKQAEYEAELQQALAAFEALRGNEGIEV